MKFRELNQRRNLLETLLRDARELPEDSPERRLALPAILQAIIYEKRGQHDECDETLAVLKLRLSIGVAAQMTILAVANATTRNREPDAAPELESAAKTDGTRRAMPKR